MVITNEMDNGYKEAEYYDSSGVLKAVKYFDPLEEIPETIPTDDYGVKDEGMEIGGLI